MTRKKPTPTPVGEIQSPVAILSPDTVDQLSALCRGLMDAIDGYALLTRPWEDIPVAAGHLASALVRLSLPVLLYRERMAMEQAAETPTPAPLPAAAAEPGPAAEISTFNSPAEEEAPTP